MRHVSRVSLLVLAISATFVSPASADSGDDAFAKEAEVKRAASTAFTAKTKELLARDARLAPLVAEAKRARGIKDKAARKAALDALAPKLLAVRNDVVRVAALDGAEMTRKLGPLTGRVVRRLPKAALPSGMKLAETTVTSFPRPFSFKHDCPDQDDRWDFDGNKVNVKAESAIADKDCSTIMAGRGAIFKIPTGAKKVSIQLSADIDLDVLSASAGAYGEASGFFGVRLHLMQGNFGTAQVGGTTYTLTSKVAALIRIYTSNGFPNPIPVGTDSFADTLQEGEDGTSYTLDLPPNPGPELEVSLITGGMVDADLQGYASVNNDMTPKSLKVTFYN